VTPQLPGVFATLAPVLDSYGYLAVGGLLFLEDFGVPAPGETVLVAAAVYAGAGQLNIVLVVVIGFLAAVAGDNVGFAVGHLGGRALVLRFGRYVFLTEERLARAEGFFTRHGGKVVTIARFVEGLRQANGVVAGLAKMPWRRFVAFNALGAALWVATWSAVGYLAGNNLTALYDRLSRYELYLLAALGVLVVVLVGRRLWRRNRRRGGSGDDEVQAVGQDRGHPEQADDRDGGARAGAQPRRRAVLRAADRLPHPGRHPDQGQRDQDDDHHPDGERDHDHDPQ
jgi:membrane protein DedA with SNARE-associated domain